jgi:GNAT superfamily N-acetyltransferase
MNPIAFRQAMPSDRSMLERLLAAYRIVHDRPPQPDRIAGALRAALAGDPFVRIWLVQQAGDTVGYVTVTLGFSIDAGGRDAFIDEIFLEEAVRGRGIAAQIMRFVEAECRKLGVLCIHVEIPRQNARARSAYQRLGFQDHQHSIFSKSLL